MTTAVEADLIPVRALNQVSYCPRLYYLEYVEAVMPVDEHVADGLFQHRRVDDPDLQGNGATHHMAWIQPNTTRRILEVNVFL
jgi:hypothetical protein